MCAYVYWKSGKYRKNKSLKKNFVGLYSNLDKLKITVQIYLLYIQGLIKRYHEWYYKNKTTMHINSALNLFQILKPQTLSSIDSTDGCTAASFDILLDFLNIVNSCSFQDGI